LPHRCTAEEKKESRYGCKRRQKVMHFHRSPQKPIIRIFHCFLAFPEASILMELKYYIERYCE
jgi:hypothetical protein